MTPKIEQVPVPQLPATPPPAPVFASSPVGSKPGAKTTTPSFLSAGMVPQQGQTQQKQLIGQ